MIQSKKDLIYYLVLEPGITVAGVPARKISNNDSKGFIDNRLD